MIFLGSYKSSFVLHGGKNAEMCFETLIFTSNNVIFTKYLLFLHVKKSKKLFVKQCVEASTHNKSALRAVHVR